MNRIAVVPSCVDLDRFRLPDHPPAGPLRLICVGSLGGRYPIEPLGGFLKAVRRYSPGAQLTVLSQSDPDLIRAGLMASELPETVWSIRRVAHAEVPGYLHAAHAGLFFLRGGIGAESCSPTKIGEYWACGLPVVGSPGAGDTDEAIRSRRVGVIVAETSADELDHAARELVDLAKDPDLRTRCRRAAEELYSLETGIASQLEIYRALGGEPTGSSSGRGGLA